MNSTDNTRLMNGRNRVISLMKYLLNVLLILMMSANSAAAEVVDPAAKIRAIEPIIVQANGIDLAYKVLGNKTDPAVLLVMGLGGSHILWGDALPHELAAAGYQVVLFDNRDVGNSQRLDEYGDPTIWWEFIKGKLGFNMNAPYDLNDMALDSVALLDQLELEQVHVVGASMGGMIAQIIAARYPERVISLTSIMSTPGFRDDLPPPGEVNGAMTESGKEESDAERKRRMEAFGFYQDALPRQLMAIIKSGDRSEEVKTIRKPTLVMHGNDDTLIPVAHGAYTAELIPGSNFVSFDGMGHNLPPAVLPELVRSMVDHMSAVSIED